MHLSGSAKETVNSSAPVSPVQTKWSQTATAITSSTDALADMQDAVANANNSIRKMVDAAKRATEKAIYGNNDRVLEEVK